MFINGGFGQFDRLTLEERKLLAEEWVKNCQKLGIYSIVHVGSTCL